MRVSSEACVDFLRSLYGKVKYFYVMNMVITDSMGIVKGLSGLMHLVTDLSINYRADETRFQPSMTTYATKDGIRLILSFPATNTLYSSQALPHQKLFENYDANLTKLFLSVQGSLYEH